MEHITPSVLIDGNTYHPPGWVYILAFAIGGCDWAIKEITQNEERFKNQIREWMREQKNLKIEKEIECLLRRVEELKKGLT